MFSALTILCCAISAGAQTPPAEPQSQPPAPPVSSTQPKIEPLKQSITVTERISTEAPAAITVLDRTTIEQQAGVNIDDRLRSVPGFTLFRRTSSLVANPTTQGVSLRGIGSSGASRTLLLWDGIPENDPFGGWVYWDRFAPQELERIEVSRGASTSVFGDLAMGGAIGLFSTPARAGHYEVDYDGGNLDTNELGVGGSNVWRWFAVSGFVRAFTTDGFYIVPEDLRGSVDHRASEEFTAGNVRFDFLGATQQLFIRTDILAEHRENGTAAQVNSTGLGSIAGNYSRQFGSNDELSVLGFHTQEGFHAVFSAIAANRNSERVTYRQYVPSHGEGGAAMWSHRAHAWHLIAGADVNHTEGVSTDRLVPSGVRTGGGTKTEHGVFAQAEATLGILQLFAGGRYQVGSMYPSAGFALGKHRFRARGSVYRAFRAPTLNELYREFRVGNADTLANPALQPETLFGSEIGFDYFGEATHASLTFYRNDLTNLISNVTLSSTPSAIVRQRRNAASSLARGIEFNVKRGFGPVRAEVAYLYADSTYSTGARLPQVPRNQATALLSYAHGGTLISGGLRAYSLAFDDDLNQFALPGFATLEGVLEQHIRGPLTFRAAVENALDRQYYVALTPTPNTGTPRLFRVGLRWSR